MFAVTRNRIPLADLNVATRQLNRLFDQALNGWPTLADDSAPGAGAWTPAVDIVDDKEQIRITAELPGVKPEDVKISVENDVLTVRGEKHSATTGNGNRLQRYERVYGTFERRFTLPTTVNADAIEARYEHGVLTVTLPKAERARPRQISVQVRS